MAGPTIGSTQLNPASPGGPAVAVDTSSVPGQLVPVSDLMVDGAAVSAVGGVVLPVGVSVSPDGVQSPARITGVNPMPVTLTDGTGLATPIGEKLDEIVRLLRAVVKGLSIQVEFDLTGDDESEDS